MVAERHLEVLDSCCWKVCVRCVRVVQNECNWEGPGSFPFLKWKFQGPSWGVEFCGIVSYASYAEFVKFAAVRAWDPRSIHLRGPVGAASGVSTQSVVHPMGNFSFTHRGRERERERANTERRTHERLLTHTRLRLPLPLHMTTKVSDL